MSYNTWYTYGYGVKVNDIKTTPERLFNLAATNQELSKDVTDFLKESGEYKIENLTLEDFDEFDDICYKSGVGIILYRAINEFIVDYAIDFDGNTYVVFPETYPWSINAKEKALTENDVKEIFEKYIKILTDEPVDIDYQSIGNGG